MKIEIENEIYNLPRLNEKNVRKYFEVINNYSLVAGSVPPYDDSKTPAQNMYDYISTDPMANKWETEGDWLDTVNGVFDRYFCSSIGEYIDFVIKDMIATECDNCYTIFDGKSITITKTESAYITQIKKAA